MILEIFFKRANSIRENTVRISGERPVVRTICVSFFRLSGLDVCGFGLIHT